jgi:hypothetical protein
MNKSIPIICFNVIVGLVPTTASVINIQSVAAIPNHGCSSCAKDAPEQEKNTAESSFDSDAKAFAPG